MKRMSVGSVFAYGYIGGMGVGAVPGFLLVTVCFLTAAFRPPDRDPELISLLYDLGMLSYNGSLGCFSVAYLVLAVAILYDRNDIFRNGLPTSASGRSSPRSSPPRCSCSDPGRSLERVDLLLVGGGGLLSVAGGADRATASGRGARGELMTRTEPSAVQRRLPGDGGDMW